MFSDNAIYRILIDNIQGGLARKLRIAYTECQEFLDSLPSKVIPVTQFRGAWQVREKVYLTTEEFIVEYAKKL